MDAVLANAVARCPFLSGVAAQEGPAFAMAIALNPTAPASATASRPRRPLLEELEDYGATFRLWHGAGGLLPLAKVSAASMESQGSAAVQVEVTRGHGAAALCAAPTLVDGSAPVKHLRTSVSAAKPLPLASMSMSFGGNMFDFNALLRSLKQQHEARMRASRKAGRGYGSDSQQPRIAGSAPTGPQNSAGAVGGTCPMRKVLGPLAPLVFNPKGHLQCPEPILRARAALAATAPVRQLRPQAIGIKLAAVGAATAAVNVPLGMAREHTEKFSLGWFIAVHASIPFVAMLRKAVIMPKYAILFTIATAIAGQAIGARMERERIAHVSLAAAATASIDDMPTAAARLMLAEGGPRRMTTCDLLHPVDAKPAVLWNEPAPHFSLAGFEGSRDVDEAAAVGCGSLLWGTSPHPTHSAVAVR